MLNVQEGPLAALREAEIKLLSDIAATLGEIGENAQEDRHRLLDVAQDLRHMFFLVVIIGEFNAGKSSFVNALLGDDLLPVGITPTTEQIELIRYGETANRKPQMREGDIREWVHPNTGAPGVALVDTPGTGSVFQKHESTAKSFLHRSDLVIFVISAKRAFAETERLYLELAKNYGKKIILVVNQVDLLQPSEQAEVRRFIERQVKDMLGIDPLMFMISARDALNARRSGAPVVGDPGGLEAVRAHLRGVFTDAPPTQQKLLAQLDMAEKVLSRYNDAIKGRSDLVLADTTKVRDVQRELENQAVGLDARLQSARDEVDRVFDGLRQRGQSFITANLNVRKIGRQINRDALQAEFQEVVIGRALRDLNEATGDYVNAVVDQSRLYWRGVIERLNQLQDLMEQELTGLDAGVYAEQRETLQEAIRIAERELKTYSSGMVIRDLQTNFETNMSNFATGAVAALFGLFVAIIGLATPGPLVGAGAAALALPAVIIGAPIAAVGGYFAVRYYRRVTEDARRELNNRINQLQAAYHEALDNLTKRERSRLTQYGNQILTPVFSRLEVLSKRYTEQQTTLRTHQEQITRLRKEITEMK